MPGCFAGYLDAHHRWGRVDLADVVAPAVHLAREGVTLDPMQMRFLHLVADLLAITVESRHAFADVQEHGRYVNAAYGNLLEAVGTGAVTGAHDDAFAGPLLAGSDVGGGLLTLRDLLSYEAVAMLRTRGFKTRRLEDGLPEWRAAGLPLAVGDA